MTSRCLYLHDAVDLLHQLWLKLRWIILRTNVRHIQQEASTRARFPDVSVEYRIADFTHPLDLAPLDSVVMANSLHFHRDKLPIIQRIRFGDRWGSLRIGQ